MTRRRQIRLGRCDFRTLVGVRLRAGAEPEAKTIQVCFRSGRRVIGGQQRETDPVHAVLRREQR